MRGLFTNPLAFGTLCLQLTAALLFRPLPAAAQINPPAANPAETDAAAQVKPLQQRMGGLRGLPDDRRPAATKELAVDIGRLAASPQKLSLALGLSNLVTEGDPGREVLQAVADTLQQSLRQQLPNVKTNLAQSACASLAMLEHYEGVRLTLADVPQLAAARAEVLEMERKIQNLDFTLTDMDGKAWSLKELRGSGRVILVNFWATWCPPCRKELPDLVALAKDHKDDLLILGVTIDTEKTASLEKLRSFTTEHSMTYPILLDRESKVLGEVGSGGIPKTFIFDRTGKLAALAIDMRTRRQFDDLLARAGLAHAAAK